MANNVAVKQQVDQVRDLLEKMKPQMEAALPRHITPDRMARVAVTCITNTPKLLNCDRTSLLSAIMACSQLGLEPDGLLGQAYLIPFGNKVQFIAGYKGLIDLARRSGDVSSILAKEVYENDIFEVDYSQEPPFKHRPLLRGERGEVIMFWCLARFKDGGYHWDYMTVEEVNAIRDNSNGYKAALSIAAKYKKDPDSPWIKNYIEMGKKTVVRRICKYLPMSVSRVAAIEDMVDAGKHVENRDGDFIVINEDDSEEPMSDQKAIEDGQSSKLEQFNEAAKVEQPAAEPVDNSQGEPAQGSPVASPPPRPSMDNNAARAAEMADMVAKNDPPQQGTLLSSTGETIDAETGEVINQN